MSPAKRLHRRIGRPQRDIDQPLPQGHFIIYSTEYFQHIVDTNNCRSYGRHFNPD
ncbi:hypothetical protein HDU92_004523, partial [Lobulomyces angularis]